MSQVPAIRFKGFADPWEQREFSEVFSFLRNNTLSRAELSDSEGSTLNVHYGDVLIKFGELLDADETDLPRIADDSLAASLSCPALADGDVIIADTAEDEAVGKCSELRGCGDKAIVSGLHTMACRPMFEFALGYLGFYMNSPAYHRQLLPLMQGIKVTSISKAAISDTEVAYPSLDEQRLIGASLRRLDSLITLHQRKYDQLYILKKALLDKMFPRDGAREPEIRFSGFTDPWEQRKLGELLHFQNGFNGSSDSFGSGIPLISVMDILSDGFITHDTVRGKARLNNDEMKRYSVEYGDVLFQRSSENYEDAGTSNVYLDQQIPASFGGFVIRGKRIADYDPVFIKYLLGSQAVRSQITCRAQGAQHINVSQDTLADVLVTIPELHEQSVVGSTLLSLDSLITLHQRKLDLLRNLKAACLDKMFVQ